MDCYTTNFSLLSFFPHLRLFLFIPRFYLLPLWSLIHFHYFIPWLSFLPHWYSLPCWYSFPCWSSLALYLTIDLLPFVHTELIWYVEGCLSLYWFTIAPLLPTFSGFYSLSIYILFLIKMIFFPFFSVWCITMSSADTSLHEFFSFFGSKIYIVFPLPF